MIEASGFCCATVNANAVAPASNAELATLQLEPFCSICRTERSHDRGDVSGRRLKRVIIRNRMSA